MIHVGDCIEVMAGMEADSVDAVVTDPPYGLEFMGKEWDKFGDNRQPGDPRLQKSTAGPYARATVRHGFYSGKTREALVAFQAWCEAWGREALRVTKPGGYLLAFGGTRTHHRLVCGLEDAGWIIRDELDWIYASGFPKGKANLKPAHEPIVLARKPGPLRPLAIDECRIDTNGEAIATHNGTGRGVAMQGNADESWPQPYQPGDHRKEVTAGRWPSNVLLSDPELFDTANPGVVGSGAVAPSAGTYLNPDEPKEVGKRGGAGDVGQFLGGLPPVRDNSYAGDSGGYSRFFLIPQRYNGTCARCDRAISADSPSYRLSPSADSAPSDAPTLPAGTQDSMALADDATTTSSTSSTSRRSRRGASPTIASQPPTPASPAASSVELTGTTTTTPSLSMCASCAEDAMQGSTLPPQPRTALELTPAALREYPAALIVPKADRSDREPVLRGQLEAGRVGGRNRADGRQWDIPGSTIANNKPNRENAHPTVKPTDLMRHLVRLVTPVGGTVLDCFLGSGSTAIAAEMEGFAWIGIEKEPEYVAIAEARLNGTQRGLGLDVA